MVDVELPVQLEEGEVVEKVGQEHLARPGQEGAGRGLVVSAGVEGRHQEDDREERQEEQVGPVNERVAHERDPGGAGAELLSVEIERPLPGQVGGGRLERVVVNTDPLHGEDHRLLELQEPPPEPQLPWDEG